MSGDLLIDALVARIRRYTEQDLESLLREANHQDVAANMRDRFPHPYTVVDAAEWITLATGVLSDEAFVIEVDGEFAGGVGVRPFEDEGRITAEIGYWLGRRFWGRGIATAVVESFVPWVFEHHPELIRVQACVYDSNPASRRVLEKNGFVHEGTLRRSVKKGDRILDQEIYARFRKE